MDLARKLPAAMCRSTWTAWLSQPAGQVIEMLPDARLGQLVARLALTAVTMSARGVPGGELDTVLHTCADVDAWRVLAPASDAASPAFCRCRRVASMLAPSRTRAPTDRMAIIDSANKGRIWPASRSCAAVVEFRRIVVTDQWLTSMVLVPLTVIVEKPRNEPRIIGTCVD